MVAEPAAVQHAGLPDMPALCPGWKSVPNCLTLRGEGPDRTQARPWRLAKLAIPTVVQLNVIIAMPSWALVSAMAYGHQVWSW